MADIYVKGGDVRDEVSYTRSDLSLYQLFTSDMNFAVEGIRFLKRGSPEWEEEMAGFRDLLKRMKCNAHETERSIAAHSSHDPLVIGTGFLGLRYFAQGNKGNPFPSFVADNTLDLICGIFAENGAIVAFPYHGEDGEPENRYMYHWSNAVGHDGLFSYDGGLKEVLASFKENGFVFKKGKWEGYKGGRKPVILPENFSLDNLVH